MAYFVYSPEAMPNPEMIGKPRYTPDNDYIKWGGISLPPLPKNQWVKLDDAFIDKHPLTTKHHRDWTDRQGTETEIPIRRFKAVIDNPDRGFASRGVVMIDHEPTAAEKEAIEKKSKELNLRFRKRAVEFFEQQRESAKARQGTYEPSPYVDECYDILQMGKPYSVEALMAQRDPGKEAVREMAEVLTSVFKAEREKAAMAVAEELTRPNASPIDAGTSKKSSH